MLCKNGYGKRSDNWYVIVVLVAHSMLQCSDQMIERRGLANAVLGVHEVVWYGKLVLIMERAHGRVPDLELGRIISYGV